MMRSLKPQDYIEKRSHMEDKNMDEKKVLTPEEKMTALSEFMENAKKKGKLTSKELMDITESL